MTLWLRTDNPQAEVILLSDDADLIAQKTWHAHRSLGVDLLPTIIELLQANVVAPKELKSVVVYEGPGSFTGLRIGIAAANSIAYSLNIPVTGVDEKKWNSKTIKSSSSDAWVLPQYGRQPHITQQKK